MREKIYKYRERGSERDEGRERERKREGCIYNIYIEREGEREAVRQGH